MKNIYKLSSATTNNNIFMLVVVTQRQKTIKCHISPKGFGLTTITELNSEKEEKR